MSNRKDTPYVVVRNNRVELRKTNSSGPIHLFAQGAVSALMNGEVIVVTFNTGRVAEYRVNPSGNSVRQIKNL